MGKKKLKPGQVSKLTSSKKSRNGGGKQVGGSSSRPLEGEPVAYGVVPSEYNIQAQINWLTAPPSTGDKKIASISQPPPPKKPQRGYHRDLCEACGEGECLMYCDKCPAAYHAICDDPPLPPEDFEIIGVTWKCKKCRCQMELESQGGDEVAEAKQSAHLTRFEGNSTGRVNSVNKFFGSCLPQISVQNPVQFKLSKEMPAYDYPFPGTSRHMVKKARQRTCVIDIENGMVRHPTVLCYHCRRSARVGALIQCDKCDMFFHLECVDPPLTTIPVAIWMCPLHVEPHLESTQLTSIALSERVKLMHEAEKPVNRNAVILNFLKKAPRRNPMFRRKRPLPITPPHGIPEMVENSYRGSIGYANDRFGPMQALAAACEMERSKTIVMEEVEKYRSRIYNNYLPAAKFLIEQRAKLECLKLRNSLKLAYLQGIAESEHHKPSANRVEPDVASVEEHATLSNDRKLSDLDFKNPCASTSANSDESIPQLSPKDEQWLKEMHSEEASSFHDMSLVAEITENVRKLDKTFNLSNLFKVDGTGKTAVGVNTDPIAMETLVDGPNPNIQNLDKSPEKNLSPEGAVPLPTDVVRSLPKKTVNKLAARYLRNCRRKKEKNETKEPRVFQIGSDPTPHGPNALISFFVENLGVHVEITKRSFWIGRDDASDWKLTDFVKCNRVDDRHAKVFYNPYENCWEVLNYSSNGIFVNNTLFGFKSIEPEFVGTTQASTERLTELTEIATKRLDDHVQKDAPELTEVDLSNCYCRPFSTKSVLNVFEGSAKLYAGHKLQIGCIKLIVQASFTS